jgi:signal transduction histidine kinase/CheY-like chemotaxis protein
MRERNDIKTNSTDVFESIEGRETLGDAVEFDALRTSFYVFDLLHELVMVRDCSGRIAYVNAAFVDILGGTAETWIGSWFDVAPNLSQEMKDRRFDSAMRTENGQAWIEWSETRFADGGAISIGRDVSEVRQAQAAQSAAARGIFAAVTHELRTPLSGALGAADLLNDTPLQSDQRAFLDAVRSSAGHALALIDDILDLTRLEAGHLKLRQEPTDIRHLVEEVCEILAPRAGKKGLQLVHAIDADVPAQVEADPGRLRQILFNLAGNAVKFTESGGVAIYVECAGDDAIRLSVRDTGPGIAKSDHAKLFEQFERGAADASNAPGAGLGLAMVRQLALAMEGEVGIQSELGSGALFWVTAKLKTVSPPPLEQPLHGRCVIIASPRKIVCETLDRQARGLGAETRLVSKPHDFAAAFDQKDILVTVILDEDWSAHAGQLKEDHPNSRILALSQAHTKSRFSDEPDRPDGIDGWLVAPVRLSSLGLYAQGQDDPLEHESTPAPSHDRTILRGLNLLLAEDDPVNAMIAKTVLSRLGAAVVHVENGRDAFELAGTQRFDLILLDLRMPEMDGLDVAKAIRELPAPSSLVPLVALTANATEADRVECLSAGMDAFFAKPLNAETLGTRIAALCGTQFEARVGT